MDSQKLTEMIKTAAKLDAAGRYEESDAMMNDVVREVTASGKFDAIGKMFKKVMPAITKKIAPEGENWFRKLNMPAILKDPQFITALTRKKEELLASPQKMKEIASKYGSPEDIDRLNKAFAKETNLQNDLNLLKAGNLDMSSPIYREFAQNLPDVANSKNKRLIMNQYQNYLNRGLSSYQDDLANTQREFLEKYKNNIHQEVLQETQGLAKMQADYGSLLGKGATGYGLFMGGKSMLGVGGGNQQQQSQPQTQQNQPAPGQNQFVMNENDASVGGYNFGG